MRDLTERLRDMLESDRGYRTVPPPRERRP